jgi:hypothetical protein
MDDWDSNFGRGRNFSLRQGDRNGSEIHPASYPKSNWGFSGINAADA